MGKPRDEKRLSRFRGLMRNADLDALIVPAGRLLGGGLSTFWPGGAFRIEDSCLVTDSGGEGLGSCPEDSR